MFDNILDESGAFVHQKDSNHGQYVQDIAFSDWQSRRSECQRVQVNDGVSLSFEYNGS